MNYTDEQIAQWSEPEFQSALLGFLGDKSRLLPGEWAIPNHGVIEYGIDIVFCRLDALGRPRYYGIQAKSKDIKLTQNRNNYDVKILLGQIAMAYNTRIPLPGESEKQRLSAFYILCSKTISPQALEAIDKATTNMPNLYHFDKNYIGGIFSEVGQHIGILTQ